MRLREGASYGVIEGSSILYTGGVELLDLVANDPDVCHGTAIVRGTRIPVAVILDSVAAGLSDTEIIDHYPSLTPEGIRAAAAYRALLAREEVLPLHA